MNLYALAEPFPEHDLEWRVGRAGGGDKPWAMVLPYISNRAVMQRLDDVCGPANWKNEFTRQEKGNLCGISIFCGGQWITKWDGAGDTDVEAFKGGLSNAMRRAAVQWGIGRYLYGLEEGFAKVTTDKSDRKNYPYYQRKGENNVEFLWAPPALPEWAKPSPIARAAAAKHNLSNAIHNLNIDSVNATMHRCKELVQAKEMAFDEMLAIQARMVDIAILRVDTARPEELEAVRAFVSQLSSILSKPEQDLLAKAVKGRKAG